MKTRELIRRLQEADPSGEAECVVGNQDIFFTEPMTMGYDGRPVLLVRDASRQPYYDVIGLRVPAAGEKVQLHLLSPEDVFDDLPDAPVHYDTEAVRERYEEDIERARSSSRADDEQVK
jgi:hypothetical protein